MCQLSVFLGIFPRISFLSCLILVVTIKVQEHLVTKETPGGFVLSRELTYLSAVRHADTRGSQKLGFSEPPTTGMGTHREEAPEKTREAQEVPSWADSGSL